MFARHNRQNESGMSGEKEIKGIENMFCQREKNSNDNRVGIKCRGTYWDNTSDNIAVSVIKVEQVITTKNRTKNKTWPEIAAELYRWREAAILKYLGDEVTKVSVWNNFPAREKWVYTRRMIPYQLNHFNLALIKLQLVK